MNRKKISGEKSGSIGRITSTYTQAIDVMLLVKAKDENELKQKCARARPRVCVCVCDVKMYGIQNHQMINECWGTGIAIRFRIGLCNRF